MKKNEIKILRIEIDWKKLEALAGNIDMVFQAFRSDVESFFGRFVMKS